MYRDIAPTATSKLGGVCVVLLEENIHQALLMGKG